MASREIIHNTHHFPIHYDLLYHDNQETMLFLHGWGSNKEIMKQAFSNHFKDYRHLYIDMPGFGKSPNNIPLTTKEYATIIQAFLSALDIQPTIMIGHSFGGKVATLLGPNTLVLLSSAGIPIPKPWQVKAKIKLFKLLKPLGVAKIGQLFASSDVSGMSEAMYETFKNVVDEDFRDIFQTYQGRALLFWGKEDTATPLYAGEEMANLIKNSQFFPLEGDHFFFLKQTPLIEETLQKVTHGHD